MYLSKLVRVFILFAIIFTMVLQGCKRREADPPAGQEVVENFVHPRTPTEVLKLYQNYIDKNNFDLAKLLSTEKEKARLDEMRAIISQDPLGADSALMNSIFLHVECVERTDSAFCTCEIQDEDVIYPVEFILIWVDSLWYIDAPVESLMIDDEIIEEKLENLQPRSPFKILDN